MALAKHIIKLPCSGFRQFSSASAVKSRKGEKKKKKVSAAEVARGQPARLTFRKSGEKLNKATKKLYIIVYESRGLVIIYLKCLGFVSLGVH